jgi:non-homologous end joining protein Ku
MAVRPSRERHLRLSLVPPSAKPANSDSKVIDLMAALKKSLDASTQRRPASSSKKKSNSRRAA